MLSIALFYFFLGVILALPDLAVRFFLINLGIEVSTLGAFYATLFIPWCLKPVYGIISDSFLLCGYRRKPYIIVANIMGAVMWVIMSA